MESKSGERFLPQTFRDRGQRIRVRERVLDRGSVTRVLAEQSRVRPVQGRDDLRHPRHGGAEHLHREVSRGRVRHRVVDMKNVEPHLARDLGHLDRERQRVIGISKEAVFVDHDLVEEDSRLREIETNGQCRAEEINFVSALREFRAEGGREDAAPADQRVAGNPDLESSGAVHLRRDAPTRAARPDL